MLQRWWTQIQTWRNNKQMPDRNTYNCKTKTGNFKS